MPNLTKNELTELKDQINTFHRKGIEAAKWGIVYFVNAGEGLHAVRAGLPPRTFKPWLDENFEGGKTTAYKYLKLAEEKGRIKDLSVHRGERIESMRQAFSILGAYVEKEASESPKERLENIIADAEAEIINLEQCEYCEHRDAPQAFAKGCCPECGAPVYVPPLYPQTPESPPSADGASMPSSEPASLANGAGGSPAPTEAEQAILGRLLKPGEMANFESGLDQPDEYQCYLCNNWFFADQMKRLHGNRYCYSCRQELPEDTSDGEEPPAPSLYETTLFDEPPPEPGILPDTNGTLPGSNGQATTDVGSTEPPAMTERDPYDEMLLLADEIFPMLSKMEAVRTYGIHDRLRRFIELFNEIHQVKT